jgi:hypothetical protein
VRERVERPGWAARAAIPRPAPGPDIPVFPPGFAMKYACFMRSAIAPLLASGLGLALGLAGCGRSLVEIIGPLPDGGAPDGGGGATSCPATLAERLRVVPIPVDQDIAWQKWGYDHYPVDERVALAVQPDGQAQIAWTEVNPATVAGGSQQAPLGVHVTPLDANLARRAPDVVMPTGQEVAGLVAHDDGFALLTRDLNPGAQIDNGDGNSVAFLLRYQNGLEKWKQALTGSQSEDAAETLTVYSPFLEGQLVWSDSVYGAYFAIEGGQGDPEVGFWRDLLVFRDSFGRPAPLSLTHGCDNNGGIRLIPDPGKTNLVSASYSSLPAITGLCVQQARQAVKLTQLEADSLISDQEVQVPGYSGAKLGSLLKIAGGYLVYWLSLGATNDHQGHDIRMARLDTSFNVVNGPTWLTRTPGVEEWNLHVVPYGNRRFLMIYEEISITQSAGDNWAMYLGTFRGTHLALLDENGAPLTDELVSGVASTANAEPVVLLNQDVAWPFVNPSPDYTHTITDPNGPGQKELHIARVRYCE